MPVEETLRRSTTWSAQGKVRYVGCSNYAGYRLVESLWAADRRHLDPYASIQIQWSLAAREGERELVPGGARLRPGRPGLEPAARGFLTGKYRRGAPPPEGSRLSGLAGHLEGVRQRPLLEGARRGRARWRGASARRPAAVSLAWLLARPEVSTVIVGARTVAQLDENLQALEVKLSPEDLAGLDAASAPDWGYPQSFIGAREPW